MNYYNLWGIPTPLDMQYEAARKVEYLYIKIFKGGLRNMDASEALLLSERNHDDGFG